MNTPVAEVWRQRLCEACLSGHRLMPPPGRRSLAHFDAICDHCADVGIVFAITTECEVCKLRSDARRREMT